jgi:hypothetical protein
MQDVVQMLGDALCDELNKSGMSYIKDDGGVYTDSAEFVDYIPVYKYICRLYSEHTVNEQQDINHLIDLCVACVSVDWESLPVVRDLKYMKQSLMVLIQSLNLKYISDRDYQYYRDWGTTNFHDEEGRVISEMTQKNAQRHH